MPAINRKQLMFVISFLWIVVSMVVLLVFPAARKGPLGFGPPAAMTTFEAKDGSYSISYPANWSAFELPDGNHGDHEVIAMVLVAGKDVANVIIARKSFLNGNVSDVSDWGQLRASQQDDYLAVSLLPLSSSELNGFVHIYEWTSPTINDKVLSHCQDTYILAGDVGYDLAFCSQEKDWFSLEDTYAEMMQSFSVNRVVE